MIELFIGNAIEAMNIKNLLDSFGIESFVGNEYISNIQPYVSYAGGFNTVALKVNEADIEQAKKVLEDYNKGDFSLDS